MATADGDDLARWMGLIFGDVCAPLIEQVHAALGPRPPAAMAAAVAAWSPLPDALSNGGDGIALRLRYHHDAKCRRYHRPYLLHVAWECANVPAGWEPCAALQLADPTGAALPYWLLSDSPSDGGGRLVDGWASFPLTRGRRMRDGEFLHRGALRIQHLRTATLHLRAARSFAAGTAVAQRDPRGRLVRRAVIRVATQSERAAEVVLLPGSKGPFTAARPLLVGGANAGGPHGEGPPQLTVQLTRVESRPVQCRFRGFAGISLSLSRDGRCRNDSASGRNGVSSRPTGPWAGLGCGAARAVEAKCSAAGGRAAGGLASASVPCERVALLHESTWGFTAESLPMRSTATAAPAPAPAALREGGGGDVADGAAEAGSEQPLTHGGGRQSGDGAAAEAARSGGRAAAEQAAAGQGRVEQAAAASGLLTHRVTCADTLAGLQLRYRVTVRPSPVGTPSLATPPATRPPLAQRLSRLGPSPRPSHLLPPAASVSCRARVAPARPVRARPASRPCPAPKPTTRHH